MEIDFTVASVTALLIRLLIFFVLPLAYLVIKTRKDPRIYEKLEAFPGPKALPLFGNSLRLVGIGGSVGIFNQICYDDTKDFGPLYRLWMLNQPKIVIASAKLAEKTLQGMQHHPKSDNYRFLHAWMGLGLLTSQGNHWRVHRKILTPAFHFSILHEFLQIFNKSSTVLCKKLETVAESGRAVNIFDQVSLCALDIIHESSMGTTINAQLQEGSPYVLAVKVLNESILTRYFSPILRLDWIYNLSSLKRETEKALKVVNEFTDKVIEDRTKYLKSTNLTTDCKIEKDTEFETKKQMAFIDLLLRAEAEDGQLMSRKDIRDEVSTFMFEGHDTVTTATCWTLFLIGTYPEVQEKVVDELRQVFGDSNRAATMNDLAELKYLERCIKETLRLYPSVPFFERLATEDIILECGKTIPAGCTIGVNAFVMHRDPEHFPNPEEFDPDRFLPENSTGRNPYAYLPFSAGPRNCIGQKFAILEEKVLVSTILRNFQVEAAHSPEEAILEVGMVLRPKNGLSIKLTKRDTTSLKL